MKRTLLIAVVILFAFGAVANAAVYTFTPAPKDLGELDHTTYLTWGLNWAHPGETITGATLKIFKIYDWQHEADSLYIHLLDNPALGVKSFYDNQGGYDNFTGQGKWISTWTDPYGDPSHKANLTYDLGALGLLPSLRTYAADGRFGFGFDPDCHYNNDSVQVCITTEVNPPPSVPEPASVSLLGLGLTGVAFFVRRKK
jgi:hypothetical protein